MAKKSKFLLEKEYYELLIVKKQYDQMTKPWYKKTEIIPIPLKAFNCG